MNPEAQEEQSNKEPSPRHDSASGNTNHNGALIASPTLAVPEFEMCSNGTASSPTPSPSQLLKNRMKHQSSNQIFQEDSSSPKGMHSDTTLHALKSRSKCYTEAHTTASSLHAIYVSHMGMGYYHSNPIARIYLISSIY